ncbi:MAG: hypothetical protein ACI3XA_07215 [Clostridia bacterium]
MSNYEICPYCVGSITSSQTGMDHNHVFVECPTCGRFEYQKSPFMTGSDIKDEIASYLYYHSDENFSDVPYRFSTFLGNKELYDRECKEPDNIPYVSREEILAFQPKSFAERIDKILLGFARKSKFFGDIFEITAMQLTSALFIKKHDEKGNLLKDAVIKNQINELIGYLVEQDFFETYCGETTKIYMKPNGWKRVDELQKNSSENSKTVFVAMSFAYEMKETREIIKKAIVECGFEPRIMDEIEHNHQIVPEMLYEIRQARFVIAELTGHNNGAYYEAGYAFGLGKEVIQVCNKEQFSKDGHLDVKQVNTVLWADQDDLYKRLTARINATIR